MQIQIEALERVMVATVDAERLDAAAAAGFKGQMVDLINQGHKLLVVDLHRVRFMDSSGLSALLSSLKTVTASGGKLAVCGVGGELANLFRLTKLEKIIPIYDTADSAGQALA